MHLIEKIKARMAREEQGAQLDAALVLLRKLQSECSFGCGGRGPQNCMCPDTRNQKRYILDEFGSFLLDYYVAHGDKGSKE